VHSAYLPFQKAALSTLVFTFNKEKKEKGEKERCFNAKRH